MNKQRRGEIRAKLDQEYAVPMAGGLYHTDCATMIADLADLLAEVDRLRVAYERLQRDYQGLLDAVRRQDV